MSNYRGITLMSITSKVYYRLLLNHIWDPLVKILCQPGWILSWLRLCQANRLVTQDTWRSQRSEPPIRWYLCWFFQGLWQHRQTGHVLCSPPLRGPRQCKEISVSIRWYQVSGSCWQWNVRRQQVPCKDTPKLPPYLSLFWTGYSTNVTMKN